MRHDFNIPDDEDEKIEEEEEKVELNEAVANFGENIPNNSPRLFL